MFVLGKRLKELRTEKNLTQKQVAEKLNIARVTFGQYENNSREPTLDTVVALAKIFNVSTDYLLGLKEY